LVAAISVDTDSLGGGEVVKLLTQIIALPVIGAIVVFITVVILGRNPLQLHQGELRCEGGGAVVINIEGEDYAVNGMAGPRYPPIQSVWNRATYPDTNIDRLIVRGLTLCEW
jgi:hypothetical protein